MANIRIERRSLCFMYLSPDHFVDFYRQNSDPTVRAFGLLDPAGQEALRDDLVDLVRRSNDVVDGTAAWNSDYLEFVASRV